jgi:hypothetical protein
MKVFMRILMMSVLCLVVLLGALVLARNAIIKSSLSAGIQNITGMSLDIGSLDVGLFNSSVSVKALKLYNPSDFPEKLMVDLPELFVRYDLPAIIKGNVHLPELKIDLKELVVVKTAKGVTNIDSLKPLQPKGEGKPPKIAIDLLDLAVGKVVYKDYSFGGQPKVMEFNINIHERHEHITDPNVLVSLIITKALRNTTISGLTNTLESADKILGNAAVSAVGSGKKVLIGVTDTAVNTVDKTVETAGGVLKGAIGGLLGGSSEKKE